jgi:monofunctional glycosyltransferase
MSKHSWKRQWLWRCLLLILSFFLLYQLTLAGRLWYWRTHHPESTALMRERLSDLRKKRPNAQLQWKWISYDQISPHLKKAVITSEDARFLQHHGFDWDGIQEAYEKNLQRKRWTSGGSTITQQLAKNLFLTEKRTLWRKAQEALIALMLEGLWSKARILEVYLNVVEWGEGVFGAEAAAQHYFHTSASSLTPLQSAHLAVLLPNPRSYGRNISSDYLNDRTDQILDWMKSAEIP